MAESCDVIKNVHPTHDEIIVHILNELLWASVIVISIRGVVNISMGQWQRYNENPTVVTLAKDFRTWKIHMPAVTACEKDRVDPKKLPSAIKSRWNTEPGDSKYDYYSRFVAAVASSSLEDLSLYEEFEDDPSLDVDFFKLAVDVKKFNSPYEARIRELSAIIDEHF